MIPDTGLRDRLILRTTAATTQGVPHYRIDIVLQGDDETPFFVD